MMEATDRGTSLHRSQKGSILVLVLFVCLAVAIVLQGLCAVVLCAERSTVDELAGRRHLEEKDQGLATLRQRALTHWEKTPWTLVWEETDLGEASGGVEGNLTALEDDAGWAMKATVRQEAAVSRLMTSTWLERGRDGLDLPLAVLVAGSITANADRDLPWMDTEAAPDPDGSPKPPAATGCVLTLPKDPKLGEGCSLEKLSVAWHLDPGWVELQSRSEIEQEAAARVSHAGEAGTSSLSAVAPGPDVVVLVARSGRRVRTPEEMGNGAPDRPVMVILTGGADLDMEDRGDWYGVIIVDDGSLRLDGTTVHGALFASGRVDLGETGRVVFSPPILRWATDRSLCRVRLVPGTRWEGTE